MGVGRMKDEDGKGGAYEGNVDDDVCDGRDGGVPIRPDKADTGGRQTGVVKLSGWSGMRDRSSWVMIAVMRVVRWRKYMLESKMKDWIERLTVHLLAVVILDAL